MVAEAAQETEIRFRDGTRVPEGVTATGILVERERFAKRYGDPETARVADIVLRQPKRYPNLRAFAPATPEEAMVLAMRRGVTYAFASVVRIELLPGAAGQDEPREVQVRCLVPVEVGESGKRSWQPIELVAQDTSLRRQALADIRRQLDALHRSWSNLLDELEFYGD